MPKVDFSEFSYYPSLQCSDGEHLAYRQLSNGDKDSLLPIFEISQRKESTLKAPLDLIADTTAGRPFILDLCREALPPPKMPQNPKDPEVAKARYEEALKIQTAHNATLFKLLSPTDGFKNWRDVVAKFPNAVPTIQFRDVVGNNLHILRQASLLSKVSPSLAIRVGYKDDMAIAPVIAQIIAVLDAPDNLLIIADAGYGRQNISKRAAFCADLMAQIASHLDLLDAPALRAVCMSSSFPQANHDGTDTKENLDWTLWEEARESFPFVFGDYGAVHRYLLTGFQPFDWRAQVVLPLDEEWIAYRDPNSKDKAGYMTGAAEILSKPEAHPLPDTWGSDVLKQAAKGDLTEIDSARAWYAAKTNIHLHRQIQFAEKTIQEYESDE